MKRIASLALSVAVLAACGPGDPPEPVREPAPKESPSEAKLEIFASGSNFAGANGIHFGPDGLLYVTSVIGSDVSLLNTATGEIVKRLGREDGVIAPDDVAFAPDGSFYWTSILTGEVAGFNTGGEKIVAGNIGLGANPIAISDEGRLFVAQCFLGNDLYELDPTGETEPRLIAEDLGDHCGLNGMDWGPDGRLYGAKWFEGRVLSFDVDTGEHREEAAGFKTVAAVKFDSQGVLHVLDTGAGELIRVENGEKTVLATLTPGLDNFSFDASDTPFISSFADGFIKRVNGDGSTTDVSPGGVSHPSGIAVVGDKVWVADVQALRAYDRNTGEEIYTERNVLGVSAIGGSFGLSADGDNLLLTSWFDGDARAWDPEANERLEAYAGLAAPVSAVRYSGKVAVAEHATGSVKLYDDGEPVMVASGLPAPTALLVDGDDLLVGDRSLGEIKLIARGGAALTEPETLISGLEAPEGFLRANNGFVVLEADASRIVFVDDAGSKRTLASFPGGSPALPGFPPSNIFNGIAADEEGNLYISGEAERKVYRITAPW